MLIHKAILAIQADIHTSGIGKNRRNKEQNFDFRGIDDALYAFAPLFTTHGVIFSPRYDDMVVTPRATKSGGTTYNVALRGTFTFTHAEDGSTHTVGPFYGEANDGQDKAVSKAESVAFRQMLFLSFCVPHEPVIGGDPDESGDDEPAPEYGDWKEGIAGAHTPADLKALKGELEKKFGNAIPKVLVDLCVTRMAEIKNGGAQ